MHSNHSGLRVALASALGFALTALACKDEVSVGDPIPLEPASGSDTMPAGNQGSAGAAGGAGNGAVGAGGAAGQSLGPT